VSIIEGNRETVEGVAYSQLQDGTITLISQILSLELDPETNVWMWDQIKQWEALPAASNKSTGSKSASGITPQLSKQGSIIQINGRLVIPINRGAHSAAAGVCAFDNEPLDLLISQDWVSIVAHESLLPVRSGTAMFLYQGVNGWFVGFLYTSANIFAR
jgi:hypothetical protein